MQYVASNIQYLWDPYGLIYFNASSSQFGKVLWNTEDMVYEFILVQYTVKPVCDDHLYNKICYLWSIQ